MGDKKEHITELCAELESMLRLRTFPLGLKRVAKMTEVEGTEGWKELDFIADGCQYVTLARTTGWAFAITKDNVCPCAFAWAMGLVDEPAKEKAHSMVGTWFKTLQDVLKWRAGTPRVSGRIGALLLAPVSRKMFEPEVILLYGLPEQIILIVNAIQWSDYERLEFSCTGESSCVDAPHQCYATGKPSLGIPSYGEHWWGGARGGELAMAIPAGMMDKVLEGLRALYKTGYHYPIPSTGSECDEQVAMRKMYGPGKLEERMRTGKSFWELGQ
jgi:uncharacterized protein (DUF169 family)